MNAKKTVPIMIAIAAVLAVTVTSSPKLAFAPTCENCAASFTPSHQSKIITSGLPGSTEEFAPGHLCSHQEPPNPCAPGIAKRIS